MDKPPHSAFDLPIEIPAEYRARLEPLWNQTKPNAVQVSVSAGKTISVMKFLQQVRKFRIYVTVPCLYGLMETDQSLAAELDILDMRAARDVVKKKTESVLWKYMKVLATLPTMETLKSLVCQIRAQENYAHSSRKVVVAAFLSMNVAKFYLYLYWLAEQDEHEWMKPADLVLAAYWDKDKTEKIDHFLSIDVNDYKEELKIMVASCSAIKGGIDLVPVDNVIIMDAEWNAQYAAQVLARVSRPKHVRKGECTEKFRVNSSSDWCESAVWTASRGDLTTKLKESVRGIEDEDEDEDQGVDEMEL